MRRLPGALAALLLSLAFVVPALAADGTMPTTGRVVMVGGGDITIPAEDQADAVVVFDGDALVRGDVKALAVFDGNVRLEGATVEEIFIGRGVVEIDAASTVLGDVRTLDATVNAAPGTVAGTIAGVDGELLAGGLAIAGFLAAMWLGVGIAVIVAALVLAAIAGRQLRAASRLIRTETGPTLLGGLAGLVVPPVIAVLAIVTVIGIPLGLAIFLGVWPAMAFVGYIVGAVWIGEIVLDRMRSTAVTGRPYAEVIVGVLILFLAGLVPVIGGLVTAIVSFVGLGALMLLTWRVFRGRGVETVVTPMPAPPAPAGTPMPA